MEIVIVKIMSRYLFYDKIAIFGQNFIPEFYFFFLFDIRQNTGNFIFHKMSWHDAYNSGKEYFSRIISYVLSSDKKLDN